MKNYGDSSSVGMVVDLVRSISTIKSKPVADQRGNNFAGSDIPKLSIIDAHESDSHGYTRIDSHLYLIGWFIWNVLVVFKHALHNHADNFIDAFERFGLGLAPGRCPLPFKRRAVGVPSGRIPIEILIALDNHFEI